MKKILITLFFFISSAFAKIVCYDLDEYQGEIENLKEVVEIIESKIVNDNYNQCITEGGVGSEFSMQVTQFVKTCAEYSGSKKGYLKFQFMCDYCTAEKINDELKIIEIPLIEDKVNETQNKIDAMVYRFHKDYGVGGSSDNYTCPTN